MNISDLLLTANINWNDVVILSYPIQNWSDDCFELTPRDYLGFARNDYKLGSVNGFINAISNSKKAIDCQIDSVLKNIGYDSETVGKNKYVRSNILNYKDENEIIDDNPIKVKFLQSIDLAPQFLLNKVRDIRNRVEHEYKKVDKRTAIEAIEVSELFIESVEHKLYTEALGCFGFGSDYTVTKYKDHNGYVLNSGITVMPNFERNDFSFSFYYFEEESLLINKSNNEIKITPDEYGYIELLNMFLYGHYRKLPEIFGIDIHVFNYIKYFY